MVNLMFGSTTGAIIDIVTLVLILIFTIIGAKRGFIRSLIKIFGTIISLLFAAFLCGTFTTFLQNAFSLVSIVGKGLEGALTKIFGETLMNTSLEGVTEGFLLESNIPVWLSSVILNAIESLGANTSATLNDIICPVFGYYIVLIISFIILFLLFKLLFFVLSKMASKLKSIPIVGTMDSLLGAALGFLQSTIIISLIILVLQIIPINFIKDIVVEIENTSITKLISKLNVFGFIINSLSQININNYLQKIISSLSKI